MSRFGRISGLLLCLTLLTNIGGARGISTQQNKSLELEPYLTDRELVYAAIENAINIAVPDDGREIANRVTHIKSDDEKSKHIDAYIVNVGPIIQGDKRSDETLFHFRKSADDSALVITLFKYNSQTNSWPLQVVNIIDGYENLPLEGTPERATSGVYLTLEDFSNNIPIQGSRMIGEPNKEFISVYRRVLRRVASLEKHLE